PPRRAGRHRPRVRRARRLGREAPPGRHPRGCRRAGARDPPTDRGRARGRGRRHRRARPGAPGHLGPACGRKLMATPWRGVVAEYADRLPVSDGEEVVTLGEGGTPLLFSPALSERTGARVHVKVEGANPTGSFKDRGMTMAMTKVLAAGTEMVVCASTGNTSASAAAYAARARLGCAVVLPAGKIAAGKLAQAVVHGARLIAVDGSFDDCLRIVRELADAYPVALVNSVNRYRLQGQQTAAFEVADVLGDAPNIHVLRVGNAGNSAAYWRGYREYAADGPATRLPRMWGVQAEGAAPFVKGEPIEFPETIATAIRI